MNSRLLREPPFHSEGVAGLLLGLALGDAYEQARGDFPSRGTIKAGVGTLLAAFSADALVRTLVVAKPPSPSDVAAGLWSGLMRWGVQQGLVPLTPGADARGWISDVPALSEQRGSAPATVSVVKVGVPGTLENPVNARNPGTSVVLRTLPTAVLCHLLPHLGPYSIPEPEFAAFAALTHGGDSATYASVAAASVASMCLAGKSVRDAVGASGFAPMGSIIGGARDIAVGMERDPLGIARWMHNSAESALAGGVYAAVSYPDRHEIAQALQFAYKLPGGRGAAAVAGALLGALHGARALPVDPTSRLELNWVLDNLGRDLAERVGQVPLN